MGTLFNIQQFLLEKKLKFKTSFDSHLDNI